MTSTHQSDSPPRRHTREKPDTASPDGGGLLLDVSGLAIHLGVTERFVRRLVEERRVPFHKIGKFVRFRPDDIDAWIERQRVAQVNGD